MNPVRPDPYGQTRVGPDQKDQPSISRKPGQGQGLCLGIGATKAAINNAAANGQAARGDNRIG